MMKPEQIKLSVPVATNCLSNGTVESINKFKNFK